MFHKLVCLLLACLKIVACASPHINGSIAIVRTKFPNQNQKPHVQNNLLLPKLYRGPSSNQIHIRPDRSRRGIVLIDEDFNVPPDPGVQGWSDGDYNSNGTALVKNATRAFSEVEGSGSSETSVPEELTLTKSTSFVTPDNLQLTSVQDHKTTTTSADYEVLEGSGDEDTQITETSKDGMDETTSSTRVSTSTDASEYTSVGVSSTHVAVTTEIPPKITDDSNEHLCMNFTCDFKDLIISPGLSETVPEGINLTLTCSLANATEQRSLKWYKYNESDHFLLKEHSDGHEINFAIPKTILDHSGTYMCFKFTEQSCCHRKLEITVYEMPNYKQHFIIIGSIVAVSLLVCILIAICKSVKGKKYEDMKVELQNAEKPFLL